MKVSCRRCVGAVLVLDPSHVVAPASWATGSVRERPCAARGDSVEVPAGPFTMGSDKGQAGANPDEVPGAPAGDPQLPHRSARGDESTLPPVRRGWRVHGADQERLEDAPPLLRRSAPRRVPGGQRQLVPGGGLLPLGWRTAAHRGRVGESGARHRRDRRVYPWGDRRPDCSLANFGGQTAAVATPTAVGGRPEGASPYGAHRHGGQRLGVGLGLV